jgi:hypothetical protein
MSYDQDPPRWTSAPEEAPELLRGAFSAGRSEGPSKAQMQTLALKIAALSAGSAVALGTAKAAAGSKVAASAASWSIAKLAGLLIVAGGIATGAVIWNRSPRPTPRATAERPAQALVVAPDVELAPAQQVRVEEVEAVPSAEVPAGQPVITSLPARAEAPEPVVAIDAPSAGSATASSAPARRSVFATRSARGVRTTRPVQRAPAQSADAPEQPLQNADAASGVPSEIELLRRAQLALRSRPREAFQLTEEHRKHYPDGEFALERDALAIQALIRAGNPSMARDLAESFLKAHPDSPHAHRFREAMGIQ